MTESKISFYSGPVLKLAGYLSIPDGASGASKRPALVLCRGLGGRDFLGPKVSEKFVRLGYAVLRFDYRGYGESEGPPNRMLPLEQVEDILNAVTFLEAQDVVDRERIGLWGAATGAAHVCYAAGVDPRIKCVVAVSAMGNGARWLRSLRRYWEWVELLKMLDDDRVTRVVTGRSRCIEPSELMPQDPAMKEYLTRVPDSRVRATPTSHLISLQTAEAMIAYCPESVVDRISPRAIMWICAGEDTHIPIEESRYMYDRAGEPKKRVVLDGVRHHELYHDAAFEVMMTHASGWFDTHLKK